MTLHYRLRGPDGSAFIDTFGDRPATLSLGSGDLAPAMAERLVGLPLGSETSFTLDAGVAFGERSDELIRRVARSALDELAAPDDDADYRAGDVVRFPAPGGQTIAGIVREVAADSLVFDFNHPLAGRAVTFDVKLIGIL